jgi:ABC-type bacteriocin/lantibiotic exporter with double-glycine peptidase domain
MVIFNKKSYFRPLYKKAVDSYTKSISEVYLMNTFSPKIVETVAVLGIFSIFLGGYLLNKDIEMLAQFLIIFTIAAYRVIPSMNKIILCSNYIKSSHYLFQYFDKAEDQSFQAGAETDPGTIPPMDFNEKLELRDVSFAYKSKSEPVLDRVNLLIKKGESVGIIGSSGSGKTTLLNILLRLYTEDQGGIFVDGIKVDRHNLVGWYKLVSYVPQDIILLDGTVVENIAFGVAPENIDQVLLKKVIDQAQLGAFVRDLAQGVDTPIGEKGVKISGGQRQRIGIARALYHGGKILILDEATSALDSETEHSISESINQLSESLTIILIAHRLNTLKHCKKIYKMENNRLQETVLQL